jgi:hypothetical protein
MILVGLILYFISGIPKFLEMGLILIFTECVVYYTTIGFSKAYNPYVNFEENQGYNLVVASIIIGTHLIVGMLVVGIFYAL